MFVFGRLFYVQVIWGEDLQKKAIDQWTREIPVIAARGKITDVNGIVLAGNADTYTVFVRKRAVENTEELCRGLSEILDMDYDYVYSRINGTVSSKKTGNQGQDHQALGARLSGRVLLAGQFARISV